MGKPTGFLEYERTDAPNEEPLSRIRHFHEFHGHLSAEEQQKQSARCMDCGVPSCQSGMKIGGMISGCPLHNLVPEWNDLAYRGCWQEAWQRLRRTNCFPEFTSRVCPALCEKACTCGLSGQPVSTRENEYVMDRMAWENGWAAPRIPDASTGRSVAVIGSGPAGLAASDRLNQRGHQVTVFEKADRPGGLLMYGIPNMKLEKDIVLRRIAVMEAEGIRFRLNADVGRNVPVSELAGFDCVILACGARRPRDLEAPGRAGEGVCFAVDFLTASTKQVLDPGLLDPLIAVAGKKVVIVGGGDTGNDCLATCIRRGAASVVQLEMMPKPPLERADSNPWPEWPRVLVTDYGQEEAIALWGEDPRRYETTVKRFIRDEAGRLTGVETVQVERAKNAEGRPVMQEKEGTADVLPCDQVIIAAGFLGCETYAAEQLGVKMDARGNAAAEHYRIAGTKLFAAGDMHSGQSLVVRAIRQGIECAREADLFLMGYTNLEVQ